MKPTLKLLKNKSLKKTRTKTRTSIFLKYG